MEYDAPPAYSDVIGDNEVTIPTAPPIAVPPIAPVIEPAPFGFDAYNQQAAIDTKEREAAEYPATHLGPGIDHEDDILPVPRAPATTPEQRGKREFVIRLACPSCDCARLVPRCNDLTCCIPDVGCLAKLKYEDSKSEKKLFRNYSWSKITDRHFRYFFRKPEEIDADFPRYFNLILFIIFLVITAVMFIISPWVALIPAIIFPCDQNSAIKPLLGTFGVVVLVESFMRSCCYVLHKIDRPHRAIKELESPNPLFFVIFGLSIALFVNCGMVTPCENSTISVDVSIGNGTCCDPTLVSIGYGVPICWVVFQLAVMLGTGLKYVFEF
eukprot:TRINITY_DN643_c0_g2_i1.p1 TRINITY_DN643_c0_g2~~TRINITY_DN643_c0_g2_i1.p1  ORF type:complete len:326 (-),score=22.02 TRINITY_DN643_c0_g2_i1:107-1084(-)